MVKVWIMRAQNIKRMDLAQPVVGISNGGKSQCCLFEEEIFRAARTFFLLGRARGTSFALGLAPDDPPASIDLIDLLPAEAPHHRRTTTGGACPHESTVLHKLLLLLSSDGTTFAIFCRFSALLLISISSISADLAEFRGSQSPSFSETSFSSALFATTVFIDYIEEYDLISDGTITDWVISLDTQFHNLAAELLTPVDTIHQTLPPWTPIRTLTSPLRRHWSQNTK
jgi:hypothetical protein